MKFGIWLVLVGALTVAACAPVGPAGPVTTAQPQPQTQAVVAARPAAEAQVAALPPAAPVVPPPPSPPTMELTEFFGLSPFEVATLLGDPDLDRREPTAQVLQYAAGEDCVLHLFMYQTLGGGLFRVEHAEVLPRGVGPAAQAACITALLVRGAGG